MPLGNAALKDVPCHTRDGNIVLLQKILASGVADTLETKYLPGGKRVQRTLFPFNLYAGERNIFFS